MDPETGEIVYSVFENAVDDFSRFGVHQKNDVISEPLQKNGKIGMVCLMGTGIVTLTSLIGTV